MPEPLWEEAIALAKVYGVPCATDIQRGADIRTIQELLGPNDVSTTMICSTQVPQPGACRMKSPLDCLKRSHHFVPMGLQLGSLGSHSCRTLARSSGVARNSPARAAA